MGCFYYSVNLNWAAQNLGLGRGLDIAALERIERYFEGYKSQIKNRLAGILRP